MFRMFSVMSLLIEHSVQLFRISTVINSLKYYTDFKDWNSKAFTRLNSVKKLIFFSEIIDKFMHILI